MNHKLCDKMVVIVISGQSTCGSTTTGNILAKKLGVNFFSVGRKYKEIAKEKTNEKETKAVAKFFSTKDGSKKSLHKMLDEMQVELAKRGNIVIDSKLGIRMIKNADLKVYLKAKRSVRIKRVAKRDHIPIEDARKILLKKDELEEKNFYKLYGFHPSEQEKEADIIIDTSDKTPEEITNIILNELKARK